MSEGMLFGESIYFSPESLEDSTEKVSDFQRELRAANEAPIIVADITQAIKDSAVTRHKSLTQSCIEQIDDYVGGEYARQWVTDSDEAAVALVGLENVLIARTSIAESSAHKVFFARLSSDNHHLRVAVKPFRDDPGKAAKEWINMKLAQERGFDVFQPMGFIVSDKGYLVTRRNDGVEPMDNAVWTHAFRYPDEHQGLLADLKKVGPALARVHDRGCYHGDPQLKNLVITQTGSVHLIDWEAATFGYAGYWTFNEPDIEATIRRRAVRDLKIVHGSLARSVSDYGVGMLSHMTPATRNSVFNDLVLSPYVEERMNLIEAQKNQSEYSEAAVAHVGEIELATSRHILERPVLR